MTTAEAERSLTPTNHPQEVVDSALIALVFTNGNASAAARAVNKQHGTNVHDCTIGTWRDKYRDRYLEIREEIEPKVRATLAARHEDAALKALDKTDQALDLIDPSKIPPADLGKLTQQLAVASGIHTDKSAALRGRPTEITEHRHAVEILNKLRAVNPALVVEGTATETTDELPAVSGEAREQRA